MAPGSLKGMILVGSLLLLGLVRSGEAHSVSVFAYVENGQVFSESYFQDGRPVSGGTIEILDSRQQKVAEGVTDENGRCVLSLPKGDDLTVVINAQLGHRGTCLLRRKDLGE